MELFNQLWEWIVWLSEPFLLWLLLRTGLSQSKQQKLCGWIGIPVLAAAAERMDSAGLPVLLMLLLQLAGFCLFAFLLFRGPAKEKLLRTFAGFFAVVLSKFVIWELALVFPIASGSKLPRELLSFGGASVFYLSLLYLLTLWMMKMSSSFRQVSGRTAAGLLLFCLLSGVSLYLLLETTYDVRAAGRTAYLCAAASALIYALTIAAVALVGNLEAERASLQSAKAEADALRREIDYNSDLIRISNSVRQLKHDYANHMNVIASLTQASELEKLRQYMADYCSEYGSVEHYAVTGEPFLDALLACKLMSCEAQGVSVKIIAFGWARTALSEVETISLFGNLIDNAVNACKTVTDRERSVKLFIQQKADMLNIKIVNSTDGLVPPEALRGGLGIPRIRSIVERHDGVCEFKPENGSFTVDLLIPALEGSK